MKPLSLLLLFASATPLFAQRDAKTPDPDPELERKTFILPEGFEVNLFAADPMLAKPIQMNFDSKGRLWVAASEVYPQIKPGQKANDKILILEDTKGVGVADKTTVFADGLLIPTAVEPDQHGGCYAADSTDVVHFSDPDPKTGKATKKRIVLSGFGTEDTHHILHTFRTGPDCRLYMSQSVYIHSHIETPHGVRRLNAGGIWQYQPDTEKLEIFARGWWNTWGTAWNKYGTTFATDGAGGQGINYVVPGAWYEAAKDPPRVLPGLNPGSPKYCGLEVVSGRHLPDDWQQNLITNDFRGHRVCRYVMQEDGAGFASKEQKEVINSNHPAFRPIDVKMGPDGAIYIADWYNPIIQHGEVDFRDERRDKTHGRIWRVTAKGRKLVDKPTISGAKVEDLLELLKAPEDWTRGHARRELKARGQTEAYKPLIAWEAKQTDDAALLEALWVYQALDVANWPLITKLMECKTPAVRASAWRVAGEWASRLKDPLSLLTPLATDEHPRVRLEAVRALAVVPGSTKAIASALEKPVDRWLDYAIWHSLRETKDQWLPLVKEGKFDFGGDPKKLVFALQAAGEADVTKPLLLIARNEKLALAQRQSAWKTLAKIGSAAELTAVFREGYTSGEAAYWIDVMESLEQSFRTRRLGSVDPRGWEALYDHCAVKEPVALRRPAYRLIGLVKDEPSRNMLENRSLDVATDFETRRAVCDGLISMGGPKTLAHFIKMADAKNPISSRKLAVTSLSQLDTAAAAKAAVEMFVEKDAADLDPIFAAFVARKDGPAILAKALDGKKLTADVAKVGVRVAKANGQADAALVAALTKAGNLTETRREFTKPELETLLADVKTKGDPARGELVYRRAELNCLKCHGVAGSGGQVGPDMTSIGASAQVDYLVESLLNPNAKIKEGYNSIIVTDAEDRVFAGIKVRETPQQLVLRDAEDKEIVISKADKPQIKPGRSLMPDGLTDGLTRQEFVDLVRFLTELGKGPYLAQPGKVVRRWQTVVPTPQLFTAVTRDRLAAVATATDLTWAPAYSTVFGELPLADLAKWKIGQGTEQAVARFALDCTTAGRVKLRFGDVTGLSLWLDGTPLEADKDMVVDLSAGTHAVTVHVKLDVRKTPLRAELDDVPGSAARVRIVGGK